MPQHHPGQSNFPLRLDQLPLLGFGLYLFWGLLLPPFEKGWHIESFSSAIVRFYAIAICSCILFVTAAIRSHQTGQNLLTSKWATLCAICGTLSPTFELIGLNLPTGGAILDILAIMARSVSDVGFFLMWNSLYSRHRAAVSWSFYAASFAVASVAFLLLIALGTTVVTIGVFVIPAVVGILLVIASKLPDDISPIDEVTKDTTAVTWKFPWRPVVLVAAFSFAQGLAGHFHGDLQASSEWGRLIVSCAALACFIWAFDRFDVGVFCKACPAFVVAGLLACILSSNGFDLGIQGLLVSVGYNGFTLYLYIILSTVCFRFSAPSDWLFGVTRAACLIIGIPAAVLGDWLNALPAGSPLIHGVIYTTVIVLVALSMLLMSDRTPISTWGIKGIRMTATEDGASEKKVETADYLTDHVLRCALVARHYGLTHREEEVLALLAQGSSFQDVEETLYIAHGTMRVHVQHIYAKLCVHSCEEACQIVRDWKA